MKNIHDKYFRQAKREGHLARSIYKLEELDRRSKLFRRGDKVLDIGASPGSWLEYILEKIGPDGVACAVDLKLIAKRFKEKVFFLKKDIREVTPQDFDPVVVRFDVIVSDMAPNTSGIKATDQYRSLELCESAFELAEKLLKHGGFFVCKILEGPEMKEFRDMLRTKFAEVKTQKPDASRDESMETYLVGLGYGLPPKPKKEKTPDAKKKSPKKRRGKRRGQGGQKGDGRW